MGNVAVDELKRDMILADDVRDIKSRFLLPKGKKLELNHIKILKIWGITEVSIEGTGSVDVADVDIDQELIVKIHENAKHIFKKADLSHPALAEIFRLSVEHRSKHKILTPEKNDGLHIKKELNKLFAKDLHAMIKAGKIKLPEIPAITLELNEIIDDPMSSAGDIAGVVGKSPSLTALLLKIVNSAIYSFPSKIDSISRAVTVIGTREISSLALGISTVTIFKDIPEKILDMRMFLKHSLACGIIARILATFKNITQTEQLFVSGLLHDIGRVLIYKYYPEQAKGLLQGATKSGNCLYEEEISFFGCNHTHIGKYLLRKWKLPLILENNLFYHHNPSIADNPKQATIVHLADIIANGLGLGTSGERLVPPLDYVAWDKLGLSPSCFDTVVRQAVHQLFAIENLLEI